MRMSYTTSLILSATLSLAVVVVAFGDELARRLGAYFHIYTFFWIVAVYGLLILALKMVGKHGILNTVLVALTVGYLSTLFAYVLAVVLDVHGIREIHKYNLVETVMVSLVFPFFVLRGWLFCVLFALTSVAFHAMKRETSEHSGRGHP